MSGARRPCIRCGVTRYVNESRPTPLCHDCRQALTATEAEEWAA